MIFKELFGLQMIATDFAQQKLETVGAKDVGFAATFRVLCGSRGVGKADAPPPPFPLLAPR